mmetsp:Transcript_53737/g.123613  ORF Transcript_53737/g.123613 Transcript_53737/m.123613 type:complete len:282 (+) Transcript_53737:294-1139(+)
MKWTEGEGNDVIFSYNERWSGSRALMHTARWCSLAWRRARRQGGVSTTDTGVAPMKQSHVVSALQCAPLCTAVPTQTTENFPPVDSQSCLVKSHSASVQPSCSSSVHDSSVQSPGLPHMPQVGQRGPVPVPVPVSVPMPVPVLVPVPVPALSVPVPAPARVPASVFSPIASRPTLSFCAFLQRRSRSKLSRTTRLFCERRKKSSPLISTTSQLSAAHVTVLLRRGFFCSSAFSPKPSPATSVPSGVSGFAATRSCSSTARSGSSAALAAPAHTASRPDDKM